MIWLWKFHFLHPICKGKQWAVADPIQNTVQRGPCHCVDFVGILSRHLINYSTSKYSKRIDYYFQLHPCSVLGTLNIIFWLYHKRSKVFLWPINCKKSRCIALHVITEDFRVRLHCSPLVLQAIALQGASIMKPIYVLTFVISKNYCFQMQVKPTFYTPLKVGVTFCIPKMRFTTTQNCWIDEKIMHKNCQKFDDDFASFSEALKKPQKCAISHENVCYWLIFVANIW